MEKKLIRFQDVELEIILVDTADIITSSPADGEVVLPDLDL